MSAFEKEDIGYFFGREEEAQALYEMTYNTRLILLYGASGTGKTSLVQCGLANKFKETRWKELFIRRENNINDSIRSFFDEELRQLGGTVLGEPKNDIERIEFIYRMTFTPIYLIFDQFEELFIVNPDEDEQNRFFHFVSDLMESKIDCKVFLIMREEFIAHLWNFEQVVPFLFDDRYRIESMRYLKMGKVIENTLNKLQDQGKLAYSNSELVADKILKQLTEGKAGLELTYLQVYLDRLYQEAEKTIKDDLPAVTPEIVEQVGSFEDIISQFLDDQFEVIEAKLGKGKEGVPLKILSMMITDEQTKKVLNIENLDDIRIKFNLSEEEFEWCLNAFENMRILKRYDR